MIRVGIVAPSSVVPKIEFELGCEFLREQGYELDIHPTVLGEHYFYPAPDAQRAQALIDYASSDELEVIWCARGGYGATHLLPYLNKAKQKLKSKKKKLLIGYSDATALLEWFRANLGWQTLHAPMPSLRTFSLLPEKEWSTLQGLIAKALKRPTREAGYQHSLTPVYLPKNFVSTEAKLVGGNLFVWNSSLGTPDQGQTRGKILFLEEIGENLGRIHRMLHHLEQTGGFKHVEAVVFGDFLDCPDSVPRCLSVPPPPGAQREEFLRKPPEELMKPLRRVYSFDEGFEYILKELGARNQIPVFKGVPAGHGPHFYPLALGKKHKLSRSGTFKLI